MWFVFDRTPDDQTSSICMLAIGCFTFTTALEIYADPNALRLCSFLIVLITAWSKIQPSILNNRNLPVWLLFLPHLRAACLMAPVNGQWVVGALRDAFSGGFR